MRVPCHCEERKEHRYWRNSGRLGKQLAQVRLYGDHGNYAGGADHDADADAHDEDDDDDDDDNDGGDDDEVDDDAWRRRRR